MKFPGGPLCADQMRNYDINSSLFVVSRPGVLPDNARSIPLAPTLPSPLMIIKVSRRPIVCNSTHEKLQYCDFKFASGSQGALGSSPYLLKAFERLCFWKGFKGVVKTLQRPWMISSPSKTFQEASGTHQIWWRLVFGQFITDVGNCTWFVHTMVHSRPRWHRQNTPHWSFVTQGWRPRRAGKGKPAENIY